MRTIILCGSIVFSLNCYAVKNSSYLPPDKINNYLQTIPARHSNLLNVLQEYGLDVVSIQLSEPDSDDIRESQGLTLRGDKFIDIVFRKEFLTGKPCPIWGSAAITVRNKKYIPDGRTMNFLLNNKCITPNQ